ncbi:phage major capsid protein HK97 family [Coprococcus eutactus CAG:665]|jgi:HK97 family phage major capsid protein|nr:phage major capsid protein HK97 family [Coprococcus eutactus CAG:665]
MKKKLRNYLQKTIDAKNKRATELKDRIKTATTADEVRSLGDTLDEVLTELEDAKAQLAELDDEGDDDTTGDDDDNSRAQIPVSAELRGGTPFAAFATVKRSDKKTDRHDTPEYRSAFMEYVCRGVEIPAELRTDVVTGVADASAVIPTSLMNEIITKMDTYGNVYKLIRKLNVQGGIAIPILSLKPEAAWVGEGKSDSQKIKADEKITFSYFGVECKIAQTLLANVVTLEAFQALFVPLATEAIVKAVEIAIFKGNGTSQPQGITTDKRIPKENIITMTPSEFASWDGWHKKVKAKMKKAYRNGAFFMNQSTFDGYIDGMVDKNGQPLGRTNYGINGEETYRFMGKDVETVEDDMIASWDDAAKGDVVAVFFKGTDYAVNTNMQMTTVKWVDHDTNEVKNKCIMIVDGKLIDPNGVLVVKKGEEPASSTQTTENKNE